MGIGPVGDRLLRDVTGVLKLVGLSDGRRQRSAVVSIIMIIATLAADANQHRHVGANDDADGDRVQRPHGVQRTDLRRSAASRQKQGARCDDRKSVDLVDFGMPPSLVLCR